MMDDKLKWLEIKLDRLYDEYTEDWADFNSRLGEIETRLKRQADRLTDPQMPRPDADRPTEAERAPKRIINNMNEPFYINNQIKLMSGEDVIFWQGIPFDEINISPSIKAQNAAADRPTVEPMTDDERAGSTVLYNLLKYPKVWEKEIAYIKYLERELKKFEAK